MVFGRAFCILTAILSVILVIRSAQPGTNYRDTGNQQYTVYHTSQISIPRSPPLPSTTSVSLVPSKPAANPLAAHAGLPYRWLAGGARPWLTVSGGRDWPDSLRAVGVCGHTVRIGSGGVDVAGGPHA